MGVDSRLKRLALGTSSIFLLIVGVLLGVPQMYLMAVVISLLPVVFWCLGHFLQTGLVCERLIPASCGRGERIAVRLKIRNGSPFPKFYLRFSDHLPRWILFDGNAAQENAIILSLRSKEEMTITYYLRPRHRGKHEIGPIKVTTSDLIGISNYTQVLNEMDNIIVYPEIYPVRGRLTNEGNSYGWHDQENAEARGSGSDFQGVREYRVGDDLRRLNWKTTARTGNLAVTEYALGFAKDVTIVLDLNADLFNGVNGGAAQSFETAVEICASIAAANLKQGSAVRLIHSNGENGKSKLFKRSEELSGLMLTLALVAPIPRATVVSSIEFFNASNSGHDTVIVITGEKESNQRVQDSFAQMNARSVNSRPIVFWIDVESFEHAYTSGSIYQQDLHKTASPPSQTDNSINIAVNSGTSVRDLLSRSGM